MKQNQTTILVKEIENILGNYIGKGDTEQFLKRLKQLRVFDSGKTSHYGINNLIQFDSIISESAKNREFVHSVISFAEERISEECLFRLLYDLIQLMIFNGELVIATEICEYLIFRIDSRSDLVLLQADVYLSLAKITWSQAYWEQSIAYVKKSYELYQIEDDHHGYAKCENILGSISGEQGDVVNAYNHFEKALELLADNDDVSLRAMIEINLGILLNIQGEYAKAMWNYKNALNKFIHLNDPRRVARVRHNLGMLYTRMKDYQAALEEFDSSISLSLENGYLANCAIGYIGKAYIYTKMNNTGLAEAFTDKALEIAYKINDILSIADIYKIKGMIQGNLENYELSAEMLENSLRLNEDLESKMNIAEGNIELSNVYSKTARNKEAEDLKESALGYYSLIKAKSYIDELLIAYSN